MLRLIMMTMIYGQKIILFFILQLSDVIDRQQNLERTNLKLREGTDEVVCSTLYQYSFRQPDINIHLVNPIPILIWSTQYINLFLMNSISISIF